MTEDYRRGRAARLNLKYPLAPGASRGDGGGGDWWRGGGACASVTPSVELRRGPHRKVRWHMPHLMLSQPPSLRIAAPQCGHGRQPVTPSIRSGHQESSQA